MPIRFGGDLDDPGVDPFGLWSDVYELLEAEQAVQRANNEALLIKIYDRFTCSLAAELR